MLLVNRLVFPAQPANWRPATVAFFGVTNLPSGQCAILALENQSPTPLKLRNIGYLEYYRRPVNNSFNRPRSYATGTNYLLRAGQRQQLFLPVSEEGTNWFVSLEFTHAGFQARLAEALQKIRGRWVEILPEGVRTVRSAPVQLHLHREDPLAKDGGAAGVAPLNLMFLLAGLARVTKVIKRWAPNLSLRATPAYALLAVLSQAARGAGKSCRTAWL